MAKGAKQEESYYEIDSLTAKPEAKEDPIG